MDSCFRIEMNHPKKTLPLRIVVSMNIKLQLHRPEKVNRTITCNPMTLSTVGDVPRNGLRVKTDRTIILQTVQPTARTHIPSCSHGNRKRVRVKHRFTCKILAMALVVQAEAQTAFLLKVITIIPSLLPHLVKGDRITTCSLTKPYIVGNALRNG